jgi:hypothetical protein
MDGFSSSKFTQALKPATYTAALGDGTAIDGRGFQYAIFIVSAGAVAGSGAAVVQIESSATSGGTYTDVTGAVVTADTDGEVLTIAVRLDGTSGWVRTKDATSSGTSIDLGVTCMLTNAINSANYASTPTVTV